MHYVVLLIVSKLSGDGGARGHQFLCSPAAAAMARGFPLTPIPVSRPHCIQRHVRSVARRRRHPFAPGDRRCRTESTDQGRFKNSRWWQSQETQAQGVIGREEMIYYKHLSFSLSLASWEVLAILLYILCYPFISFKFILFVDVSEEPLRVSVWIALKTR
jgi:hypothetical protein